MGVINPLARQGLLKRLAGLSLERATGEPCAAELLRLPQSLLEEVIGELERGGWALADRRPLMELLAEDPRPAVKRRLAQALARPWPSAPPGWVEPLLARLSVGAHGATRVITARSLSRYLAAVPPETRTEVLLRWATAASQASRATLARALCWRFPARLAPTVLGRLALDPEPAVRGLALVAACCRYHEWPEAYAALLKRLSVDRHPAVRRASRRAARAVLPDLAATPLRLA